MYNNIKGNQTHTTFKYKAPMFLVSNTAMVKEGMKSGIAGCILALNYESEKPFLSDIRWAVMWLWLTANWILKM